jgi:hypothetical protein
MNENILERIAVALEKIADLMEAEDQRRRRRTINEMNEKRQQNRVNRKNKRQHLPKVDPSKVNKTK